MNALKLVARNDRQIQQLLPLQARALAKLEAALQTSFLVSLVGRAGLGKSLIAEQLKVRLSAEMLTIADYQALLADHPMERWDERVFDMVEARLMSCDTLILEDHSFLSAAYSAPRSFTYVDIRIAKLREIALRERKHLILVGRMRQPDTEKHSEDSERETANWIYNQDRSAIIEVGPGLEPEDYGAMLASMLGGERALGIDVELVHLHAPHLTIRQLALACRLLPADAMQPDTRMFIDILGDYVLRDNMRLNEVETLSFDRLPGSEEIAKALETHVIMPFENPEMARRLGIKAKRGVMLFGPPGTGKTAIGRALAHRMKGRFFLIDGSIGTEPAHGFIARVKGIIQQAVKNAPCVLFIDDADTLFTIPHVAGIVRYLLSLLDGMESESAGKVCVMMTVMDAAKVPEALTRSGRVELWLETTPPDVETRAQMLARWEGRGLPEGDVLDFGHLASLAGGLVPADLRRVMDDARLLYVRDLKSGGSTTHATAYVERAIRDLIAMRQRMSQVLEGINA